MNTITLSLWKFNKKTTDESIVHYFNNYYYHRGEVFGGGDVVAIVHLNNCSKTPSSKPRKAFFLNHFKTNIYNESTQIRRHLSRYGRQYQDRTAHHQTIL